MRTDIYVKDSNVCANQTLYKRKGDRKWVYPCCNLMQWGTVSLRNYAFLCACHRCGHYRREWMCSQWKQVGWWDKTYIRKLRKKIMAIRGRWEWR